MVPSGTMFSSLVLKARAELWDCWFPSVTFFNHTAIRHAPSLPWLIRWYQSGMSTPWQLLGGTISCVSSPCPSCLCSTKHLFPLITDHRFLSPPDNIWRWVYLWWVNKRPLRRTRGPVGKGSHEPSSETLPVCPWCSSLRSAFHSTVNWCSNAHLGVPYQSWLFFFHWAAAAVKPAISRSSPPKEGTYLAHNSYVCFSISPSDDSPSTHAGYKLMRVVELPLISSGPRPISYHDPAKFYLWARL